MLFSGLIRRVRNQKETNRSAALAADAITRVGLPWRRANHDLWVATSAPRHGFQVELRLLADRSFISLVVEAYFNVEKEFVARELLWYLLEKNAAVRVGSFSVCPTKEGYQIIHCHHCDTINFSPAVVASIGRLLIGQMEDVIEALHDSKFI